MNKSELKTLAKLALKNKNNSIGEKIAKFLQKQADISVDKKDETAAHQVQTYLGQILKDVNKASDSLNVTKQSFQKLMVLLENVSKDKNSDAAWSSALKQLSPFSTNIEKTIIPDIANGVKALNTAIKAFSKIKVEDK